MNGAGPRAVLLGLGNDILGDDAVGLQAVRRLRSEFGGDVEIVECAGSGLDLLDVLEGYERALLLDAVVTGAHPPGSVLEFSPEDFQRMPGFSPHGAGIPEVLELGRSLGVPLPSELHILAMEVEDPFHVREGMSATVEGALPRFADRARGILSGWVGKTAGGTIGAPPTR